jgi:hypothetical protein
MLAEICTHDLDVVKRALSLVAVKFIGLLKDFYSAE